MAATPLEFILKVRDEASASMEKFRRSAESVASEFSKTNSIVTGAIGALSAYAGAQGLKAIITASDEARDTLAQARFLLNAFGGSVDANLTTLQKWASGEQRATAMGDEYAVLVAAKLNTRIKDMNKAMNFSNTLLKLQRLGLANVEVRLRDILSLGFDEKEADVVCLDMADADKAIPAAAAALKDGGVLVGYAPQTEQLSAFVNTGLANGIGGWFCCESLLRPILVRTSGVRPANVMISHTGFLAFGRKGAPTDGGQSGQKQKRFKELMAPLSGPRPEKVRKKKPEEEKEKMTEEIMVEKESEPVSNKTNI